MVTIKPIKVDKDVLDKLEKNRKHFRETPNDILRRLLKLNSKKLKGGLKKYE